MSAFRSNGFASGQPGGRTTYRPGASYWIGPQQQQPKPAQQAAPQPGFKSTITGLDGQRMDPGQFYAQRDALIQLLNDDNARYQRQSGAGAGPGSGFKKPDFAALWSQAGNMVKQGWQNPFSGLIG